MADFVLGRIKFVWKGSWAGSTAYIADDVVRYGGNAFIALANHTSSTLFETDLAANPTKWQKMVGGVEYKTDHADATYYKVDDIYEICNKLKINIKNSKNKNKTKKELYDEIYKILNS